MAVAESGLVAAQSASAQSAARESLLLQQAAAATEKQTQLDKIIDTYMVTARASQPAPRAAVRAGRSHSAARLCLPPGCIRLILLLCRACVVVIFQLLTAMQVRVRSNGWTNCRIVNPAAGRC